MRWVAVSVMLFAACGRIGFDSHNGDGGVGDTIMDAPVVGRWQQVATSGEGTCAITLTGELWCWGVGNNSNLGVDGSHFHDVQRVDAATDWTDVTTSYGFTCGLRGGGELWCWGYNNKGSVPGRPPDSATSTPTHVGTDTWTQISAWAWHGCGIRSDGVMLCWGEGGFYTHGNGSGLDLTQPTPVSAVGVNTWRDVMTTESTTCGIQTDGSLWCWGTNSRGQIGNGTQNVVALPYQVMPGTSWASVDGDAHHTCALDSTGTVYCWGAGSFGELGTSTTATPTPRVVAGAPVLSTLEVGENHSCGLDDAHELWCWGDSQGGQYELTPRESLTAVNVGVSVHQISAASFMTCIVDDFNRLSCSGHNWGGQAGPPGAEERVFVRADTRTDWNAIAAGGPHACGITTSGAVLCWGDNINGELGTGQLYDEQTPVDTGVQYTTVSVGANGVSGLQADGSMWTSGQHMSFVVTRSPTMDFGPGTTSRVSRAADYTCRITSAAALVCGGSNSLGQLGDGSMTPSSGVTVAGSWKEIAAAYGTTCGINTADAVSCWGSGMQGQLGNGTNTAMQTTPSPVSLAGATGTPTALDIGIEAACALMSSGELWCWGTNNVGVLGTGNLTSTNTPVRSAPVQTWLEISIGDEHICAIGTDHSLWCWGHDDTGQCGFPGGTGVSTPTRVGTETTWAHVAAAEHFTCAVKTDGTRWCTGANGAGQYGNGLSWRTHFTVIP